jgi:putative ABC transport system ATP-binding protein
MDRDRRAEIRNDRIGFVFQNFNLLPRTSACENVELPLIYSGKKKWSGNGMKPRAMECLARVGLKGWEEHTPSQLSGGEQQRVAIARALVNEPAILLADEPTGNLDTTTSEQIMSIFQSLNEEGITIVLITHEADIADHARRIINLRDGKIVADHPVHSRKIAPAVERV